MVSAHFLRNRERNQRFPEHMAFSNLRVTTDRNVAYCLGAFHGTSHAVLWIHHPVVHGLEQARHALHCYLRLGLGCSSFSLSQRPSIAAAMLFAAMLFSACDAVPSIIS